MRKFLTVYKGDRRAFSASTHVVARRLANAAYRAETWEEPETSAIVVIDVEASGYSAFDAAWQVLVCDASIKVEHSVTGIDEHELKTTLMSGKMIREFNELRDQLPTLDESLQAMLSNRGVELPGMGKSATFDGEAGTYSDPKCYACPGESVWAQLQQEDLDKVFAIHSRRAGDRK